MYARVHSLFDSSRSALLLMVDRGVAASPTPPSLPPNAMRANDLPQDPGIGSVASISATSGFAREPSTWTP
jgi:hypothetical protein